MAQKTVEDRMKKDFVEKESWYKERDEDDNDKIPNQFRKTSEGRIPTQMCSKKPPRKTKFK